MFEVVTPDNKEYRIGKVKVREVPDDVTEEEKVKIEKYGGTVEIKMHRLDVIDERLSNLNEQKAAIEAAITECEELRANVEAVAKKVKLLEGEEPVVE